MRLTHKIEQETKGRIDEQQREFLLREQLKTIQQELGETEDESVAVEELGAALEAAKMPEEVAKHARKELKRLARMHEGAAEYSMLRTYLEWLSELPWALSTEDRLDIGDARRILDEDHCAGSTRSSSAFSSIWRYKLNPAGAARSCASSVRRGGQDLAGAEHCPRHRAEVRPCEPRRRARRGRDPRSPAHLHRRLAGQHRRGAAQGRQPQLRDDARRDRQARCRHPGRPLGGAARGARPGAEREFPRQLPCRALRPLGGDVHRHRQRARQHSTATAGPDGADPVAGLHRGGKGP